jgi:hypothetical protein
MDMTPERISGVVNHSGFHYKLGLPVSWSGCGPHGWKVLYTEHSWRNQDDGTDGLIDNILADRHEMSILSGSFFRSSYYRFGSFAVS